MEASKCRVKKPSRDVTVASSIFHIQMVFMCTLKNEEEAGSLGREAELWELAASHMCAKTAVNIFQQQTFKGCGLWARYVLSSLRSLGHQPHYP